MFFCVAESSGHSRLPSGAPLHPCAHAPNPVCTYFSDQVMEVVELGGLRHARVGLPGLSGLSVEQRKRLTIAVELVANPSIVFME